MSYMLSRPDNWDFTIEGLAHQNKEGADAIARIIRELEDQGWYIVFCYLPMFGVVMAFERFKFTKGIFGSDWVGLKNFQKFFSSYYFTRLLRNTLVLSIKDLIFSFPAPIIFALLLNELRNKVFKKRFRPSPICPISSPWWWSAAW